MTKRERRELETLALKLMGERDALLSALKDVVQHARLAFPGTPYRRALDEARRVITEVEEG